MSRQTRRWYVDYDVQREFSWWFYGLSNRAERRKAVHPVIVHIATALYEKLPTYVLWWTMQFMGFDICIDEHAAINLIERVRQSCVRVKQEKNRIKLVKM